MPQPTSSGWSKACQLTSAGAELKILSAILQTPMLGNPYTCHRPSSQDLSGCRTRDRRHIYTILPDSAGSRDFGQPKKCAGWRLRGRASLVCQPQRRNIHSSPSCYRNSQAEKQIDFMQTPGHWTNTGPHDGASLAAEQNNGQETIGQDGMKEVDQSQTCSLCSAILPSEDALDEHLISCWPRQQASPKSSGTIATERIVQQRLVEEKAKLDHVRKLEDELRKARHDLQVMTRRREQGHGSSRLLDFYDAARLNQPEFLSKRDYLNMVDLYYHSSHTKTAASPDASPNPLFLEDQTYEGPAGRTTSGTNKNLGGLSLLAKVDAKLRVEKLRELRTIENFINVLLDHGSAYENVFLAYQQFPQPGVRFIPNATIRSFLKRMSLPPTKTPAYMFRYLSVIDDMQSAGIPISRAEWNSAIHLAGKSFHRLRDEEVDRSLSYWKKMENEAGIEASNATFNIMFDIAVKAGQFLFANDLFREMTVRGLRLNRIGRISFMWSCGRLGDADGVRQAYRDFVEAGEIVDTLVLNCVMVSLCNANEGEAAEQIYERMKSMQIPKITSEYDEDDESIVEIFTRYPPPGPQSIQTQVASHHLRRILLAVPKLRNSASDSYEATQARAYLKPDSVTYRTLMSYHAEQTGNLDRLTVLLDDMTRVYALPISSMTFIILFKGFAMNGNTKHSKWSKPRLETVWEVFASAMRTTSVAKNPLQTLVSSELTADSAQDNGVLEEERKQNKPSTRTDIEERRARVFDQTTWGRFLRDFTFSPDERAEADLADDPGGTDEPQAFPFGRDESSRADEYYKVRPSKWLIIWVLRAFATCTRDRRRLEEVYFEVVDYWAGPTEGQRHSVDMAMRQCLHDIDNGLHHRQWWRRRQAHDNRYGS